MRRIRRNIPIPLMLVAVAASFLAPTAAVADEEAAVTLSPVAVEAEQVVARSAPITANAELIKAQVLRATNNERARAGLRPVLASPKLNSAAQGYANSFDQHGYRHNPNMLKDAGGWDYGWSHGLSENIHITVDGIQAVADWMASPGHRKNLMDPDVDRIGIGVGAAADGGYFIIQNFSAAGTGRSRESSGTLYMKTSHPDDPQGHVSSIAVPKNGTIEVRGKVTDRNAPRESLTIRFAIGGAWGSTTTNASGDFVAVIGPWEAGDGYPLQVLAENRGAGTRVTLWNGTATNVRAHSNQNNPDAEGIVPAAYKPPSTGSSIAVHRFWSEKFGNAHFYTASSSEAEKLRRADANWAYEGTAFRVWPAQSGECTKGKVPVYRFYSSHYASHFYTVNRAESDTIRRTDAKWSYEGVAFCTAEKKAGADPVHRFWSPKYGKHFYTTSESEMRQLRDTDPAWSYEGVAWFAPTK